jgi:hypothetical protein
MMQKFLEDEKKEHMHNELRKQREQRHKEEVRKSEDSAINNFRLKGYGRRDWPCTNVKNKMTFCKNRRWSRMIDGSRTSSNRRKKDS